MLPMGRSTLISLHPGALAAYVALMAACACLVAWLPLQALSLAGAAALCLCAAGRAGARLVGGALLLAAAIALANPLFNTSGDVVLGQVLGRPYTLEALGLGAGAGLMAASLLLWLGCLGLAVGPDRLLSLMARGLPRLGLACGLAMQMAPRFADDARRVRDARTGAGLVPVAADPRGPALRRWRMAAREGALELAVVVDGGLDGAMATAASMEARGFGTGARTSIDSRPLAAADWAFVGAFAMLAAASALAAACGGAFLGEGAAQMAILVPYGLLCLLGGLVAIGGELRWLCWRQRA